MEIYITSLNNHIDVIVVIFRRQQLMSVSVYGGPLTSSDIDNDADDNNNQ